VADINKIIEDAVKEAKDAEVYKTPIGPQTRPLVPGPAEGVGTKPLQEKNLTPVTEEPGKIVESAPGPKPQGIS